MRKGKPSKRAKGRARVQTAKPSTRTTPRTSMPAAPTSPPGAGPQSNPVVADSAAASPAAGAPLSAAAGTADASPAGAAAGETAAAAIFGQVAWLMSRSPAHRHLPLVEVDARIRPPLALKQYRLFRHQGRAVAFVCWALASEEVAQRLLRSTAQRLQPQEWRSGQRPVIFDVVAPFGGADACIKEVMRTVFDGLTPQPGITPYSQAIVAAQAPPAPAAPGSTAPAAAPPRSVPPRPVPPSNDAVVADDRGWRRTVADASRRSGNGELRESGVPHDAPKLQ
jgi:cytolysin-activating lysine-acyltransferase